MFLEFKSLVGSGSRPLVNEVVVPSGRSGYVFNSRKVDPKVLMKAIKNTPECIGLFNAILNDVFTKADFVSVSENKKFVSKNEKRAADFWDGHSLKQEFKAAGVDWLLGDGYLWKSRRDREVVGKVVKEVCDRFGFSSLEFKEEFLDEDVVSGRGLQYVPATTVTIDFDEERVKGYQQVVNDKKRYWKPGEVIHAKFMQLDGSVHGFSPAEAGYNVIRTLGLIKDYAGYWFNNGGVPDNLLVMPAGMENSPAASFVQQQLREYSSGRKRGNLLTFGIEKVEKLNEFNKDMEFRQLAIYYTGIVAFSYNMPLGKIQAILGGDIKGSGASGADTEDSSYWRAISEAQDYWEGLVNSQFWIPEFGVKMRLARKNVQDKVRRVQAMAQGVTVMEALLKRDYPVSDDFFHDLLDVPREYLVEGEIQRGSLMEEVSKPGVGKDGEVLSGENNQAMRARKRKQANVQQGVKPAVGA